MPSRQRAEVRALHIDSGVRRARTPSPDPPQATRQQMLRSTQAFSPPGIDAVLHRKGPPDGAILRSSIVELRGDPADAATAPVGRRKAELAYWTREAERAQYGKIVRSK